MIVLKRDGRRKTLFDKNKIVAAISKAMVETGDVNTPIAEEIAEKIETDYFSCRGLVGVEEIQDAVETELMRAGCDKAAKAYILYREDHAKKRGINSNIISKVMERIDAKNVENSNANVDEKSFSGREKEASSDLQKMIALEYNMSYDVAKAHKEGLIYQHDLDKYNIGEHNCLFIDFEKLFRNGFSTRNGDVRPPSGLNTACQQVAVIMQIQSQNEYGGVANAHLDFDLAPFVRKSFIKHYADGMKYIAGASDEAIEKYKQDAVNISIGEYQSYNYMGYDKVYKYAIDMIEREGKQSFEALYHNLNTLESRAGSQVPFTSLNMARDTSWEGKFITRHMLLASISGIGKFHLTPIFPISIFQYKQGCNANPGDPNYDLKKLALESMSKRIYPNFVNCDWSEAHEDPGNIDTYMCTMGCRTMIGYDCNGLGYRRVGRGNNNPITIILPKLGIEHGICLGKRTEPDLDGFWKELERTLKLVEKAHLERFEIMKRQSVEAAPFMYQNGTIVDADKCGESVFESLKHNTFAFGFIGVAEMCQALFGENHVHNKAIHDFALSVVKRINTFASEFSERNRLNGSCYATPSESLCMTARNKLFEQYGAIPNVTDREYLTNSFHVPVWEEVSIFEKLECEAPFTKYPTGGTITYVELDSTFMQNLKAVEDIIDYAFKELDIPYLAFNFPIDACLDCGYQGEFNTCCPECKSENILQLRRVTGYLTADYRRFNKGKFAETNDRVKHNIYTDI